MIGKKTARSWIILKLGIGPRKAVSFAAVLGPNKLIKNKACQLLAWQA